MEINSDSKENFAQRLREAFGFVRNKDIAEQLGVSKATITLYTNGHLPPSEMLLKIAQKTGYNIHWLMTGHGEKWIHPSDHPAEPKGQVIAIYNAGVGGTGKSTAATFLSMSLARRGYQTLLVEDYEDNQTSFLLFPALRANRDVFPLRSFKQNVPKSFFKTPVTNLDFYVSSGKTQSILLKEETAAFSVLPSEILLKYAFIIIDTRNYFLLNEPDLLRARLLMTSKILIPCDANRGDTEIRNCLNLLQVAVEQSNEIEILGGFVNLARPKSLFTDIVRRELQDQLSGKALKTLIHYDKELMPAIIKGIGANEIRTSARVVQEYDQLAEEVILRC